MFQIGDKIVYPMHGAGIIEAIEEKEILGEIQQYYIIHMPIGNMQVMIPVGNVSNLGIRPIADRDTMEEALSVFHKNEADTDLPWNQQYRANIDKIKNGDIVEGAEVVRDLIRRKQKKALNTSENSMLHNAKRILVSELVLVNGVTESQANDLLEQTNRQEN